MKEIRSFCPVCGGGTVIGVDHEQRKEEKLTWEKLAEFLTKYGEDEIQHLRAANVELGRLLLVYLLASERDDPVVGDPSLVSRVSFEHDARVRDALGMRRRKEVEL